MNVNEIYEEILSRLNLTTSNYTTFFSATEMLNAINSAYKAFARDTLCLQRFIVLNTVAAVASYDLPDDCMKVLWVRYDNKNLHGKSADFLDSIDEEWMDQAGEPYYYTTDLGGVNRLFIYPQPSSVTYSNVTYTADSNHDEADSDYGIILLLEDDDGDATFTADTNHSSESSVDHGHIIKADDGDDLTAVSGDYGIILTFGDSTDQGILLLYAYEPEDFTEVTSTQTPHVSTKYQFALVYGALSKLFLKDNDKYDIDQASYYKVLYEDIVNITKMNNDVKNLKVKVGYIEREGLDERGPFLPRDQYPIE